MAAEQGLFSRARKGGSLAGRTLRELATNSAHFPVLLALLEVLQKGAPEYFARPSHWALLAAAVVQAFLLARMERPRPRDLFFGNLAGAGLYTVVDLFDEGARFFEGPEHAAYWAFSLAIGALQALRGAGEESEGGHRADTLRVAEGLVRTMIFPVVYFFGEMWSKKLTMAPAAVKFFSDGTHIFLVLSFLIIGLLYGASDALRARNRGLLVLLAERLRRYSSWFVDPRLLDSLVETEGRTATERTDRTILFMDIRGFTHWSSARGGGEVGGMLNGYYDLAGPVISAHGGLMNALTGDEVMAIFPDPAPAVACARALQEVVGPYLEGYGLGAGIGVHCGEVVEGLFGTPQRKVYSVMGMPVNIAKRLEGCAGRGGIVVSEEVLGRAGGGLEGVQSEALSPVSLKGVPGPVPAYALAAASGEGAS